MKSQVISMDFLFAMLIFLSIIFSMFFLLHDYSNVEYMDDSLIKEVYFNSIKDGKFLGLSEEKYSMLVEKYGPFCLRLTCSDYSLCNFTENFSKFYSAKVVYEGEPCELVINFG